MTTANWKDRVPIHDDRRRDLSRYLRCLRAYKEENVLELRVRCQELIAKQLQFVVARKREKSTRDGDEYEKKSEKCEGW